MDAPKSLDWRMQELGFDQSLDRGAVLPFGINQKGEREFATPRILYDLIKATILPGHVIKGGDYSQSDVTGMALNLGGGGLAAGKSPPGSLGMFSRAGKNAEPLAMDEASRLARAEGGGYTIDAYKGAYPYDWRTNEPIKAFQSGGAPFPGYVAKDQNFAGFFSNSPDVANRFANAFDKGAVYPVKLKLENPLVIDAKGKHAGAFQFEKLAKDHGTTKQYERVLSAFNSRKNDGIILKNTADEGTVYIPFEPKNVRSRFAAFDPLHADDADLLAANASPLPGLLPTVNDEKRQPGLLGQSIQRRNGLLPL